MADSSWPEVRVTRKGADRVRSGHPWIFRSDIKDAGAAQAGDTVRAVDERGKALGPGHSIVLLTDCAADAGAAGDGFDIAARIAAAQKFRESVVTDSDAYRLVYAEADFLPGLIINRYADSFAVQALDQGMERATPEIVAALEAQFAPRAIVARNDAGCGRSKSCRGRSVCWRARWMGRFEIHMNGFRWRPICCMGKKTGVFLDQRENYLAAAR